MIRSAFAVCLASALAATVQAQQAPADTVTLTPEQREAAIEAGAARARDESLQNGGTDRRVHGEVGVEVGSRGERAAYGTLVAPVGQNGVAAISYGTGQGPHWHGRRGHFRESSMGAQYSSDAAPGADLRPDNSENVNPD